MTDQKMIEFLIAEFSRYYRIPPEQIEQAFKVAKQELNNNSLQAYVATEDVLVRMFRDDSKKAWKITNKTEEAMRKILNK